MNPLSLLYLYFSLLFDIKKTQVYNISCAGIKAAFYTENDQHLYHLGCNDTYYCTLGALHASFACQ